MSQGRQSCLALACVVLAVAGRRPSPPPTDMPHPTELLQLLPRPLCMPSHCSDSHFSDVPPLEDMSALLQNLEKIKEGPKTGTANNHSANGESSKEPSEKRQVTNRSVIAFLRWLPMRLSPICPYGIVYLHNYVLGQWIAQSSFVSHKTFAFVDPHVDASCLVCCWKNHQLCFVTNLCKLLRSLFTQPATTPGSRKCTTKKSFGGFKKGFLNNPKSGAKQTASGANSDKLPFIKAKESEESRLEIPEVQDAMKIGQAFAANTGAFVLSAGAKNFFLSSHPYR